MKTLAFVVSGALFINVIFGLIGFSIWPRDWTVILIETGFAWIIFYVAILLQRIERMKKILKYKNII